MSVTETLFAHVHAAENSLLNRHVRVAAYQQVINLAKAKIQELNYPEEPTEFK